MFDEETRPDPRCLNVSYGFCLEYLQGMIEIYSNKSLTMTWLHQTAIHPQKNKARLGCLDVLKLMFSYLTCNIMFKGNVYSVNLCFMLENPSRKKPSHAMTDWQTTCCSSAFWASGENDRPSKQHRVRPLNVMLSWLMTWLTWVFGRCNFTLVGAFKHFWCSNKIWDNPSHWHSYVSI